VLRRLLLLPVLAALAAAASAAGSAAAVRASERVVGVEVPPISSTLGTFTGVATGALSGPWRVQIEHQPLRLGPRIAITGGSFTMRPLRHPKLAASVTGGSVTVVRAGAGCTDQVYAVDAELSRGEFVGTLRHHRRSILGRCVIYAATITGHAALVP
jgi:hypothetical protein